MSEMTEEEFWAALQPIETKPILYRLYYNELGEPLFYSQEDLPGNYINIDPALYMNPPTHVQVVDEKLVVLNTVFVKKLNTGRYGTPCHPQDVSIVVEVEEPHIKWSVK